MANLELTDVTKVYDGQGDEVRAVDSISLSARDGELLVVVGPSGCGKSTTLRMIAGLEMVTQGTIAIGEREVQDLVPSRRSIAMVFQSYALYEKMTVHENIEYGLKHSTSLSSTEREKRVQEMADLLQITDLLEKRPPELSGGQKQRVALGRAIVREPDVFLLDEPLSNLDAKLRAYMRTELQRIHDRIGVTTVYVTHDQKEAMTMADRIAILNDGRLQQVASPEEAYDHPKNEFVATFLGSPSMNVLDTAVRQDDGAYVFETKDIELARCPQDAIDRKLTESVRLGFRPEDIRFATDRSDGRFAADVIVSEYQGKEHFVHLDIDGLELTARVPPSTRVERGDTVGIEIDPVDTFLFDPTSGEALKTRGIATAPSAANSP